MNSCRGGRLSIILLRMNRAGFLAERKGRCIRTHMIDMLWSMPQPDARTRAHQFATMRTNMHMRMPTIAQKCRG